MTASSGYLGAPLGLLKRVSRAFYLTIRVLPRGVRRPVGLAYLLARAADTIADTEAVAPVVRLDYLLAFRGRLSGDGSLDIPDSVIRAQATDAERDLLLYLPDALDGLDSLPDDERRMITGVVRGLIEGMEFDLSRFPAPDAGEIRALRTADDLDRYAYMVAGRVGEFWTDVLMAHTSALSGWDRERMSELGIRFGKALQLTNILRDAPSDLRIGRCYLPSEWLEELGMTAEDLLDPANSRDARPTLEKGLRTTLGHFEAAETYTLAIPRRCLRLRLAALWPLLMGLATLEIAAGRRDWLNPDSPAKVSRGWVYRAMALSLGAVWSNRALGAWIRSARRRVELRLETDASEPDA